MSDASSGIKTAQSRNPEPFSVLVSCHQNGVYRICLLLLGDEQEALEAAQEVFVKACRSMDASSKQPLPLTRLYQIAVRHAFDLREKLERYGHEKNLRARQAIGDLRTLLATLDNNDAGIFLLADVEGLVPENVAEILGISTNDVTSRLSEARRTNTYPLSADSLASLKSIKAPPRFADAAMEHAGPDMTASSCAPRPTGRRPLAALVVAALVIGCAWAAYHFFLTEGQDLSEQTTGQFEQIENPPPLTAPAEEVMTLEAVETGTQTKPEEAPPAASPALPEAAPEANPSSATSAAPVPASIPVITLAAPKTADISLPTVLGYVSPPIKTPVREGEDIWLVEVTETQFWRMHRWLIAHYTRIRIPESALPGERARVKVRLKVTDNRPVAESALN